MKKYSKKKLMSAQEQLSFYIDFCEKKLAELEEGTYRHFQLQDRIKALRLGENLMAGGDGSEYTDEDLRQAIELAAWVINDVACFLRECGYNEDDEIFLLENTTQEIVQAYIAEELCGRFSRRCGEEIDRCEASMKQLEEEYAVSRDLQAYERGLHHLGRQYHSNYSLSMHFSNTGEELFRSGKWEEGMAFIRTALTDFDNIADDITLYLLSAQYYIEQGEVERGKEYLIKLCTETASNYEEAIGFRELEDVWEKYRYLVEGQVPGSFTSYPPLPFDKCTMQIKDILALEKNDMLIALSEHLDERSGYGDNLSYLNRWERNIYDVMNLSDEVNSGGFELYLTHYGGRFNPTKKALLAMGADRMAELLDKIQQKFPEKKLPGSINRMEDMLDEMMAQGIDFEKEDTQYYEKEEGFLLEKLLQYIEENRERLR